MKRNLVFILLISITLQAISQVVLEIGFVDCNETKSINVRHTIKNNTESDKSIYDFATPWSPSDYGVKYYAYAGKHNPKNIKQDFFDYGSGKEIKLKKGESLKKDVNISSYLGGLQNENKKEEIYIFWFYNFTTIDSDYKNRNSGFFVIPRNCYKIDDNIN